MPVLSLPLVIQASVCGTLLVVVSSAIKHRLGYRRQRAANQILRHRDKILDSNDVRDIGEALDDEFLQIAPITPQLKVKELEEPVAEEQPDGNVVKRRRQPRVRQYKNRLGFPGNMDLPSRPFAVKLYTHAKAQFGYLEDNPANRQIVRNFMVQWFKKRKEDYKDMRDSTFVEMSCYALEMFFIPNHHEIVAASIRTSSRAERARFEMRNPTTLQRILYYFGVGRSCPPGRD